MPARQGQDVADGAPDLEPILNTAEAEASHAIREALVGTGMVWPDHNLGSIALIWDGQGRLIRWRAFAIPYVVMGDHEAILVIRGARAEDRWQGFERGRGGVRFERWARAARDGAWFLSTTQSLKENK